LALLHNVHSAVLVSLSLFLFCKNWVWNGGKLSLVYSSHSDMYIRK
jgi:hypothetical protein